MILDNKKHIKIGTNCNCRIQTSLRHIIDIGLKPALENITTIIAASIENTELFGKYNVKYLFLLEEMFALKYHCPLYNAYTRLLQHTIEDSLEFKEKDLQAFVLKESIYRLMQPENHKQPCMYDRFVTGNLQQASSETYGIRIVEPPPPSQSNFFLTSQSYKSNGTITIRGGSSAIVVLQKGQMVPDTGVIVQFGIEYVNLIKENVAKRYFLNLGKENMQSEYRS